ncbi:MAG TPA: hypothetical protein VK727_08360, partial [Steroidobacteraceae bacterium]|nr:hypothetical protein [Steroidobacteraceae bacterium]
MHSGMRIRAVAWLSLAAGPAAHAMTALQFSLNGPYVTSAGVYDDTGRLLRTLWSGRNLAAGAHTFIWDDRDDTGQLVARPTVSIRLLYHRIRYHWDGVIGNTSASFTGPGVHHSMFPPSSIALAGSRAVYAVGYNEGGVGTHGFSLNDPQRDLPPVLRADAFTAWSLVATDGRELYWANIGGLSAKTFVAASSLDAADFTPFSAGTILCLNYLGPICYPGQEYKGIIDIGTDHGTAPTGLAVQTRGHILAVAHARQGTVELFDKATGARLRTFTIPVSADASNQLAAAPNGDLWVITGTSLLRYTALDSKPALAATISGLSHPLAVAVHPSDDDVVLVADGGASQQVKAYDHNGRLLWTYGQAGGYGNDPSVDAGKLWFRFDATLERTALAVQANGSFWVV